ncbi:DUF1804 family protein [Neisseria sp. Ec49-e6-T10]|uniref:DUF1804 family protein n=1 Tax=Neisseria sp. Ec49-e6-T10 TaxID=3140744 RepID=UPI003EBBF401
MAHPQDTRDSLRKSYIYDQLSLEIAAAQQGVSFATARRWKSESLKTGDDWDKVKAAHTLSGKALEGIGREILTGFLLQYRTTMTQLETAELPPSDKVDLLASLSDAFNKTVAANKRILPETSQLATAIEVLNLMSEYIQVKHPVMLKDFVQILEGFGQELERKYG